jgi:iron(III) transport system substrate-binding protein
MSRGRPDGATLRTIGPHWEDITMKRKSNRSSVFESTFSRRRFLQTSALAVGAATLNAPFISRVRADEGIVWYSGSSARSVEGWADKFQKQTGIQAETFRTGGVKLAQKFEAEVKAGQVRCSVMDSSVPGIMMDWVDRGLISKYESPEAKNFPDDVRDPGYWAPIKALVLVLAYNADIIKAEDAPKSWEDILDPKWKDKMVMADATYSGAALHWFASLRKHYGKSFMEKLSKQNVLIREGSGATADTVTSGERPLSPMMLHYRAFADIDKGANMMVVMPEEGVPLSYMVIGIPKDAPNPEGGQKFIDFALSKDAQTYWQTEFHTPSLRNDVEPLTRVRGRRPLSEVKRINSSPGDMREFNTQQAMLLDEWNTLFK